MRGLRIASHALLFGASLVLTLLGIQALLDAAGIEPDVTRLATGTSFDRRIEALRKLPANSPTYHVVYLGDSMVIDYPEEKRLPSVLQDEIGSRFPKGRPVRVYNFGQVGTGIFDYYLLADRLAHSLPDMVILPFNLSNTAPAWRGAFARPELAGWVAQERLLEALGLPLGWIGLTADRLLFNHAVVRFGGLDLWTRLSEEQTRVEGARLALEHRFADPTTPFQSPEDVMRAARDNQIRRIRNVPRSNRYSAAGIRYLMGPALEGLDPDHPALALLGATVRHFRARDIDVLVYVNPINREHIESLGMLDERRLARTLASIELAVGANGGHLLDLHDAFPDTLFRDQTGHFRHEEPLDGTRALAARLAPAVVEMAGPAHRRKAEKR